LWPGRWGFWLTEDPRAEVVAAPAQVLPAPVPSGAVRARPFRKCSELIAAKVGGEGPPI